MCVYCTVPLVNLGVLCHTASTQRNKKKKNKKIALGIHQCRLNITPNRHDAKLQPAVGQRHFSVAVWLQHSSQCSPATAPDCVACMCMCACTHVPLNSASQQRNTQTKKKHMVKTGQVYLFYNLLIMYIIYI